MNNRTRMRMIQAALAAVPLAGCSNSLDRTLFGPDVPETTRGAQAAQRSGYPNVFAPPEARPPLLTPAEQEEAKKKLEASRKTGRAP